MKEKKSMKKHQEVKEKKRIKTTTQLTINQFKKGFNFNKLNR